MQRCSAKTKRGHPCRGYAVEGSSFCFTHDPALDRARFQARRLGGYHRRVPPNDFHFSDADLKSPAGLVQFLDDLIHVTCSLHPSVNRSRVLGYLTDVQNRSLELNQMDERLRALEHVLMQKKEPHAQE